jgi:hypothetical protein
LPDERRGLAAFEAWDGIKVMTGPTTQQCSNLGKREEEMEMLLLSRRPGYWSLISKRTFHRGLFSAFLSSGVEAK